MFCREAAGLFSVSNMSKCFGLETLIGTEDRSQRDCVR